VLKNTKEKFLIKKTLFFIFTQSPFFSRKKAIQVIFFFGVSFLIYEPFDT